MSSQTGETKASLMHIAASAYIAQCNAQMLPVLSEPGPALGQDHLAPEVLPAPGPIALPHPLINVTTCSPPLSEHAKSEKCQET